MKCKNCNNEVINNQGFCNVCGSKIEVEINLSDVDKTSINSQGVVNYDFDFSDQIRSNTPNPNNITVRQTQTPVQAPSQQIPVQVQQVHTPQQIEQPIQVQQVMPQQIEQPVQVQNNPQQIAQPVQVQNNPQQNINNNNQYSVLGRNDHKHSHAPIIIICILSVLVGGGYFVYNTFFYDSLEKPIIENTGNTNNEKEDIPVEEDKEETKEDEKTENKEENKETSTESSGNLTVPVNKISYSGVTLEIPTTLLYRYEEETLVIYPENEEWAAAFAVSDGDYYTLKNKKAELAKEIENTGLTIKNYGVKFYGGTEWLTFETEYNSVNILVVYVNAKSNRYGALTIQTLDNTYNYNLLRTLAPVVQSIK